MERILFNNKIKQIYFKIDNQETFIIFDANIYNGKTLCFEFVNNEYMSILYVTLIVLNNNVFISKNTLISFDEESNIDALTFKECEEVNSNKHSYVLENENIIVCLKRNFFTYGLDLNDFKINLYIFSKKNNKYVLEEKYIEKESYLISGQDLHFN